MLGRLNETVTLRVAKGLIEILHCVQNDIYFLQSF